MVAFPHLFDMNRQAIHENIPKETSPPLQVLSKKTMGAYKYLEEMWRPKLSAELPQSYQDRGWLLFSTHKSVDDLGMVYDWGKTTLI